MFLKSLARGRRSNTPFLIAGCMLFLSIFIWENPAQALMGGVCSDCHTMHNSQDNAPMNFDNSSTANNNLTRGNCFGCHAQGGPSAIVDLGSSQIPQVFHNGAQDLAGGNFAYITGLKGSGGANNKGHNIGGLTGTDAVLYEPPGGIVQFGHDDGYNVNTNTLSCAGTNGCHGYRYAGASYPEGIAGSHHKNVSGQLISPSEPGNSYRFLMGVKGLESIDWELNPTASNHNEYFAIASPVSLGCSSALSCHGAGGVQAPDGTMSQFCATCHGNFHTVATSTSNGIGIAAISPFIRHPTDLSLPSSGEYTAYTVYDVKSPVGRLSIPATSSSSVVPGSDAVMCLSCHVAHGSDFPSMLRWDYSTMLAGNGGAATGSGCFACHTTKD